jgi:hypothetical protein
VVDKNGLLDALLNEARHASSVVHNLIGDFQSEGLIDSADDQSETLVESEDEDKGEDDEDEHDEEDQHDDEYRKPGHAE